MSDTESTVDAEAIPPVVPETTGCKVEGCGKKIFAKGLCQTHYKKSRRAKETSGDGGPAATTASKPKKEEPAARMPVPPIFNRMLADLPYAAVPIITARTGLPFVLPMVDNVSIVPSEEMVMETYKAGREAFDEWMKTFGGLKVHPAVAYFGSVLATIGTAGYLGYTRMREAQAQVELQKMRATQEAIDRANQSLGYNPGHSPQTPGSSPTTGNGVLHLEVTGDAAEQPPATEV